MMSSFFWGELNGKDKKKWVAWKHMGMPVAEGGIGVRLLHEVQTALHMRFARNLLRGNSLWANFFKAKYVGSKPWLLIDDAKGSRFWRMVARCTPLVLNSSKWRVKEGDIYFWYDKWQDNGPLINELPLVGQPLMKIKECRLSDGWDVNLLENLVGLENVDDILVSLCGPNSDKDVLVWTQSEEGLFSVQSTWQCIRGSSFEWHSWIWHNSLPLKMSIHFWKAWHRALSVDDRLRRVGIPIVSEFDCCCVGHYEDINHVLFEGDFPRKIWLTFSNLFGLPMGRNWEQHVSSWFRHAKSSSQVGVIVGLMPVIITWRLWRRRCLA
ncbi:hypothetical protein I3760_06G058100 [Carya illinoinensis]|nr:hypothetical protein I3760_06G058100 [Carya illinoinensis]